MQDGAAVLAVALAGRAAAVRRVRRLAAPVARARAGTSRTYTQSSNVLTARQ